MCRKPLSKKLSPLSLLSLCLTLLLISGLFSPLNVSATDAPPISGREVSTFDELKTLLESTDPNDQNLKIILTGDIELTESSDPPNAEQTITVQQKKVEITTGDFSLNGKSRLTLALEKETEFKMLHAHLKGCKITANHSTLHLDKDSIISDLQSNFGIVIDGASLFEILGTVRDNTILSENADRPVIFVTGKSQVVMKGGVIAKNRHDYIDKIKERGYVWGGAVFVRGNSQFLMESGVIQENQAAIHMAGGTEEDGTLHVGLGGGILVAENSLLEIRSSDAVIAKNKATNGGGICIYQAQLTLNGGLIQENELVMNHSEGINKGAGLCLYMTAPGAVNLLAGEISRNDAGSLGLGGAIYLEAAVGERPAAHAYLENLLISGNHSTGSFKSNPSYGPMGGGLWFCETGRATIHLTKGSAIYENRADQPADRPSSGDDFAAAPLGEDHEPISVKVSDRLLGGGEILWYKDGQPTSQYGSDINVPRYRSGDSPLKAEEMNTTLKNKKGLALKSIVQKDDAKALAMALARLKIEDNTSNLGGGIAVNGQIDIGDPEIYKIEIRKDWPADSDHLPPELKVHLAVGPYEIYDMVLNAENQWQAVIENFPDPATLIDTSGQLLEISVREESVDGFVLERSDIQIDTSQKLISIHLVNEEESPEGPDPSVPGPSTEPSLPVDSNPPETSLLIFHESTTPTSVVAPTVRVETQTPSVPVTGEASPLPLASTLLLISLAFVLLRHRQS